MQPESSKNKPVAVLVGSVITLILIWGVVLPSIATWPHFQKSQQRFEESGVNPTAFFYTDHPRMLDKSFRASSATD